jgi:hypothetical protein
MRKPLPEHLARYLTHSHSPPSAPLNRKWLNLVYRSLWKHRFRGSMKWKSQPHAEFLSSMESNAAFDSRGTDCGAGVVITTWNRPEYLQPCLESLAAVICQTRWFCSWMTQAMT